MDNIEKLENAKKRIEEIYSTDTIKESREELREILVFLVERLIEHEKKLEDK